MEPLDRLIRRREPSEAPLPDPSRHCSAAWQPYTWTKPSLTVRSAICEPRPRKIVRLVLLGGLCVAAALDMHASARRPLAPLATASTLSTQALDTGSLARRTLAFSPAKDRLAPPAPTSRTDRQAAKRTPHALPTSAGFRAYSKAEVQALIRQHAAAHGIDPSLPLAIAQCESGFKWNAANPQSSARGVFQYVAGTWRSTREGRKGTSVFDTEAHIRMAVTHIATLGTAAWNASRGCWDNAATALTDEVNDVFGES